MSAKPPGTARNLLQKQNQERGLELPVESPGIEEPLALWAWLISCLALASGDLTSMLSEAVQGAWKWPPVKACHPQRRLHLQHAPQLVPLRLAPPLPQHPVGHRRFPQHHFPRWQH